MTDKLHYDLLQQLLRFAIPYTKDKKPLKLKGRTVHPDDFDPELRRDIALNLAGALNLMLVPLRGTRADLKRKSPTFLEKLAPKSEDIKVMLHRAHRHYGLRENKIGRPSCEILCTSVFERAWGKGNSGPRYAVTLKLGPSWARYIWPLYAQLPNLSADGHLLLAGRPITTTPDFDVYSVIYARHDIEKITKPTLGKQKVIVSEGFLVFNTFTGIHAISDTLLGAKRAFDVASRKVVGKKLVELGKKVA